jgi:hypothetical protein
MPATEFSGDYIEQSGFTGKPAHLRIRQVDNRLFLIQLNETSTGVVLRDGLLSGDFNLPLKGEFPFNFKMIDARTGVLRIKNKAVVFRKT